MDGKLAVMAKSTVFAGCGRRELVGLGRMFEVAQLASGAVLPAGDGRWLHLVLGGRGLVVVQGQPHAMLGPDAVWPGVPLDGRLPTGADPGDLVALTELTLASVARRALRSVAEQIPSVAVALGRIHDGPTELRVPRAWVSPEVGCTERRLAGAGRDA